MLIPIQIPPGLARGATPYDNPGRWWDCNLIRWIDGTMQPVGGWARNTATPLDSNGRMVMIWRDNIAVKHTLVGTDNKLYVDDAGTWTDISPAALVSLNDIGVGGGYGNYLFSYGLYGTARPASVLFDSYAFWTGDNWGEDAILTNNADGRLFYYDVTTPTTAPTVIVNAPTMNYGVCVTEERHVMVVGASGDRRTVAWSSSEDTTDWNFSSTTNTAGTIDLSSKAPLLIPRKVREGVLILSQTEVYLGRYVGLPFVYGFEKIAESSLLNPKAVAVHSGVAEWIGKGSFWQYAGGVVTALPCPIANDVFNGMDPVYGPFRCHAAYHGQYPEVWYFYPSIGQTECDTVVIHNFKDNWWAWGMLGRSAMQSAGAFKLPVLCGTDKNIYTHETGFLDAGAPRVNTIFAESSMLAAGNGDRTLEIMQAQPGNGHGYASLSLEFFSRLTPEGSERTFGPYSPRSDGYTDTRVSGRDVRMRVISTIDDSWSVGNIRLDATMGSGR